MNFVGPVRKPRRRNGFNTEWEDRGGYLSFQGAWGSQKDIERDNPSFRPYSKMNHVHQPAMTWRLVSS